MTSTQKFLTESFARNVALADEFAAQRSEYAAHLADLDRKLAHLSGAQRDALFGQTWG
jgi:hypothetical protein